MAEPTLSVEQVKVLIPDGVPKGTERMALISDLVTLAGETPEMDPDSLNDALHKAARVLFADGLLLKDWEEVQGGRADAHRDRASSR